jgi:hypothetical protein
MTSDFDDLIALRQRLREFTGTTDGVLSPTTNLMLVAMSIVGRCAKATELDHGISLVTELLAAEVRHAWGRKGNAP